MIPISVVDLGPGAEELVQQVLKSGHLAQGARVAEFEARFAELTGVTHAVAVNNGTTALVAALRVLELEPGDEVITTPFTFVATLNAIVDAGASVRFADIADADFNIDPALVEAQLTDRTRVLLPVHLYGQCADLDRLDPIVAANDLQLVEDSAQAHGATIGSRAAGATGLGCFSFYATKNITTGEGGMITTDDDRLADRLRILRNQGMRSRYQYEMAGNNYRLTDLQAVLALPQLDGYATNVARRRANAAALSAGLAGIDGVVTPSELPGRGHVWHQYTIRITGDAPVSRDTVLERLQADGIGCGVYYPKVVFDYDCFAGHPGIHTADLPVARRLAGEVLSLPVHPALTDAELDRIVEGVRDAVSA
ncbi:MAG TPA: DegT/DnrJ/EryC1/StrS family aminotransferase [Microthrixaceae bacterium]|jgi:dTDP-4-amino-4,6-dideoxygalactose transaminase|nr:DegT/DnrJ/EryC1/StrS family aminotransferase [Microthrixaceae bacterium]HQF95219.1 DegT/DnrJ/EryC1/StrS family aminotransferase [Microthrixaceae bacterium]